MVGMAAIDAWNISRLQEQNNLTLMEYSDILVADMIDATNNEGGEYIAVVVEW